MKTPMKILGTDGTEKIFRVSKIQARVCYSTALGTYSIIEERPNNWVIKYPRNYPSREFDTLAEAMENVQSHYEFMVMAQLAEVS